MTKLPSCGRTLVWTQPKRSLPRLVLSSVSGEILQGLFQPVAQVFQVGRAVGHDRLNAAVQLRQDHVDQGGQHRDQHDDRHQHRQAPSEAGRALLVRLVQLFAERVKAVLLEAAHQRGQQIGEDQAPDKGAEDARERPDRAAEDGKIAQRHEEQNGRRDHQESRYAPVQIFFIPAEMPSHRPTSRLNPQ